MNKYFVCFHNYIRNRGNFMDLDININEIDHEDLILLYNKVKDFISYLSNEIETSEVEKKAK